MTIQAPHEVNDIDKLNAMIEMLKSGKSLPPILVHANQAYSGTHRLAAWAELDINPDVIEIDDDQFYAITDALGIDPMYDIICDFELFLDTAHDLNIAIDAK